MTKREIEKLMTERTALIDGLLSVLEKKVKQGEQDLLKKVLEEFVDRLDKTEAGRIKNTLANKRLLSMIDKSFNNFGKDFGVDMVKTVVDGVSQIAKYNYGYFTILEKDADLLPIQKEVFESLKGWLGIDQNGSVNENGYLKKLLGNLPIANEVRALSVNSIIAQKGWTETKRDMQRLIATNPESTGLFQKYYRNYVYDMYSQVDRATAMIYKNKLGYEFAIYEGGLIKRSRKFCIIHNGKVYHSTEIEKFDPKVAKQPNYDPFIDLGGYGCRHHLNWIPKSLAKIYGKDVAAYENNKTAPEPEKPKAKTVKPKTAEVKAPAIKKPVEVKQIKKDIDFNEVEVLKLQDFKAPKSWDKHYKSYDKVQSLNKDNLDYASQLNKLRDKYSLYLAKGEPVEKILSEYSDLAKKYNENLKTIKSLRSGIEQEGKKFFEDLIKKVGKPKADLTIKIPSTVKGKRLKDLEEVFDNFKSISSGYEIRSDFKLNQKKGRAYYQSYNNTVTMQSNEDLRTFYHELAHSLENNNYVLKQAVEFLERRTKDSKILSLRNLSKGYRKDEVYKEGGFIHPYIGKLYKVHSQSTRNYKDLKATEVISMGIENMFVDPFNFYRRDKEHFNLIFNLFFKK